MLEYKLHSFVYTIADVVRCAIQNEQKNDIRRSCLSGRFQVPHNSYHDTNYSD